MPLPKNYEIKSAEEYLFEWIDKQAAPPELNT